MSCHVSVATTIAAHALQLRSNTLSPLMVFKWIPMSFAFALVPALVHGSCPTFELELL